MKIEVISSMQTSGKLALKLDLSHTAFNLWILTPRIQKQFGFRLLGFRDRIQDHSRSNAERETDSYFLDNVFPLFGNSFTVSGYFHKNISSSDVQTVEEIRVYKTILFSRSEGVSFSLALRVRHQNPSFLSLSSKLRWLPPRYILNSHKSGTVLAFSRRLWLITFVLLKILLFSCQNPKT